MTRPPRIAVIPTNGRACLKECLMAIQPQVDATCLIYTTDRVEGEIRATPGTHFRVIGPPNISRWWNIGLNYAKQYAWMVPDPAARQWDVALLNDDVIVPDGWFDEVAGKMRDMKAAAGCSGAPGPMPILHTHAGPVPLHTRLQGFAFILAGEKGVRANEEFRWYFSDDYMDWESRKVGGMVMVPGFQVNHLYPNGQMTPEMQVMCAEDAQKFKDHYGVMPW